MGVCVWCKDIEKFNKNRVITLKVHYRPHHRLPAGKLIGRHFPIKFRKTTILFEKLYITGNILRNSSLLNLTHFCCN